MRRAFLLALMISLSLLAGCASGGKWEERLEEKRFELTQAQELSFTVELSADLGDTVFECAMGCVRRDGETVMTVLSPDTAAGVTARFTSEGAKLEYDGVELSVGETAAGGLTPAGAVPLITDAMLSGHAVEMYTEKYGDDDMLAVRTYVDESTYVLLWFDTEDMSPMYAQVVCGFEAAVSCEIKDFTYR